MNERRISPLDSRRIEKRPEKIVVLRQFCEVRAVLGDCHETPARLSRLMCPQPIQKIKQQRVRLDPLPRLARKHKKCPVEIDLIAHAANRRGVSTIEQEKSLRSLRRSGLSNCLRCEVRIPHRDK